MKEYVILVRFSPEAFREPKDLKKTMDVLSAKIKGDCPKVVWKGSYGTLGRYDVVDIVESDDQEQVEKAAMLIRACFHATTETLPAKPLKEFLANL
ncbi:GYD domain-containing protein [Chloroflexota bacterium]